MEKKTKRVPLTDNRELIFETGKIARQADGAVLVRLGDTMVFATACAATKSEEGDFLPLRVDYQEKFFSAGKTLGGFIKREGKPSEKEILVSRLIDRPLRPMFEEGYFNEVQLLAFVWSYDGLHQPDPLAICAASAALCLSSIPLVKPVAGVRVGYVGGKFIINPTTAESAQSTLDLMLAGTEDAILMIEGYANFLSEEIILDAIAEGHKVIATICRALAEWQTEVGKPKDRSTIRTLPDSIVKEVESVVGSSLTTAIRIRGKQERETATKAIQENLLKTLTEGGLLETKYKPADIMNAFSFLTSAAMRKMILEEKVRTDGRSLTDIRPIDIEINPLPRAHGSTLFTRGETQTLAVCTLGGESMGQRYEDLDGEGLRRFFLQYFFPPFSVGEVGRYGPPGRRELGHGKLAERSLLPIIPTMEEFPYTLRLESNITESNGSSSMASVCGGCLALMDAGVPIKRPVAGIAMGLILGEDKFAILSDILGIEDALGDMDFKVSGDEEGITAFQMDIKVEGITLDIMREALYQAKKGRIHILKAMTNVLPQSKKEMSVYAPRIETIKIKPSKIATVIGPGGKQIRAITEKTGVKIDINDSGLISISSPSPEALAQAKAIIEGLVGEVEVGKVYHGKIVTIVPFGVFVEILPGQEGLCHISELSDVRIQNIQDYVKEGDPITVKVVDINERGQLKLSRRATLAPSAPPQQEKIYKQRTTVEQ